MPHPTTTTPRSQRLHKIQKSSRPRRNTTSSVSTSAASDGLDHVPQMSKHQCCGVVEEVAVQARERRANRTTPQPWIVRKLIVFLALGIMGYAGYVYIGRFCISAILRNHQAATGRPTASEYIPPATTVYDHKCELTCCWPSCPACSILLYLFMDDLGVY